MNPEIQKWYQALEEADRRAKAGDAQAREDAFNIADTIRQLEAQEQAPEETEPVELTSPLLWGAAAAVPAAVKSGASLFRAEVPPPSKTVIPNPETIKVPGLDIDIDIDRQFEGTPGPGGSGRSRLTTFNTRTQEISEASNRAKQNLKTLHEKGVIGSPDVPHTIAGSTKAGVLVTPGGLKQLENAPKPSITQRISGAASQVPSKVASGAKAAPGAVVRGVANIPGRATASGFAGGALAGDAYNYRQLAKEAEAMGDTEAAQYYNSMAAVSAVGSGAGFLGAFAPSYKPKTRALALPAGALGIYNYLQSQKGYPAPGQEPGVAAPPPENFKSIMKGYAKGGLAHLAAGKRALAESGFSAAKKAFAPKPTSVMRASEALGPHEGKYLYVTESDRMRSTGGDLGGPGFSKFQLEDPRYAEAQAAWGVGKKGKASEILNINKRFPEDKIIWSPLIGSESQHRSNQHVYDMLTNEFSRQAGMGKLTPELREAMNKRLETWKKYAPMKMQGIDVANPESLKTMGNTFDRRASIAEVLGGEGVGGRKGQIFDYPGIMQEMTDPMVIGAPTHSVGTRLFSLTGDVDYRPDLHSAFPYILKGEDKGVAFNAVPKELMLGDWMGQVRDFLAREPGSMDFVRGVKGGHGRPNQFISEEFLRKLEAAGHKKGGLAEVK